MMLVRSSSTPVFGSLVSSSSFSESPNHENNRNSPSSEVLKKISFYHGSTNVSTHFNSFSCSKSSPLNKGFRRAQSDGNLEGLAASASCGGGGGDYQEFSHFSSNHSPFRSSSLKRTSSSKLQSVPSLSIYNSLERFEEEDDETENGNDGFLQRSATMGSCGFTFGDKMGLIEENEENNQFDGDFQYVDQDYYMNPSLFLARGLGIDILNGGGGGGGGFNFVKTAEGGAENENEIGEYYKRMVEENPCSSLFLRNYAQFLKSKGDLHEADEYYSRAILADPRDGDILSQYARLVWELHHDYERSCGYFERAVQAAPEDSHVHAAYARFLWEAEDCEEEDQHNSLSHKLVGATSFHGGSLASATA